MIMIFTMNTCTKGYTNLVEELIVTHQAELNHVENDGWSALHFATIEGTITLLALSIQY